MRVVVGQAAEEILSADRKGLLVVMVSHGRGGLGRAKFGNTASEIRRATCCRTDALAHQALVALKGCESRIRDFAVEVPCLGCLVQEVSGQVLEQVLRVAK